MAGKQVNQRLVDNLILQIHLHTHTILIETEEKLNKITVCISKSVFSSTGATLFTEYQFHNNARAESVFS